MRLGSIAPTLVVTALLVASIAPARGSAFQEVASADEYEFAFADASAEQLARRKAILDEAQSSGANEWAGRYMADVGDLSYRSLLWAPRSGYLLYRYSDTPWPLDPSIGRATLEGDLLRLDPEVPIVQSSAPAYRNRFQLVRWGQRHYLVAPEDLVQFCCAVNSTADDEIGRFLRKAEKVAEPHGYPSLAPSFSRYLRLPPISAKVVAVSSDRIARNEWPMYRVTVTLSAGASRGVQPGMAFWLADAKRKSRLKLRVQSVERSTSKADVVEVWSAQTDASYFPRRGSTFRNRPTRRDREPWSGD
jgi:hypothetical protein